MDTFHVVDLSREAIRIAMLLGGPLLIVALLIGLAVNIVQTLTQLHEPVVSMVPRLFAVLLAILVLLPWMVSRWLGFTTRLIGSLPDMFG